MLSKISRILAMAAALFTVIACLLPVERDPEGIVGDDWHLANRYIWNFEQPMYAVPAIIILVLALLIVLFVALDWNKKDVTLPAVALVLSLVNALLVAFLWNYYNIHSEAMVFYGVSLMDLVPIGFWFLLAGTILTFVLLIVLIVVKVKEKKKLTATPQ